MPTVGRFDSSAQTIAGNAPQGGDPALYAVAGCGVAVFTDINGTVYATTYTDATGVTTCPNSAQVTLPGSTLPTAFAGPQGQFGFWLPAGTYYYTITLLSGLKFGPYPLSVGSSSGGAAPTLPFAVPIPFTPQSGSIGQNLIIGVNSITLTPVPIGVNGTDTNHPLLISGGTGTAESPLIIGGTAVSGAATGTVFVTCTSTHTGAWTIQSATAGIQEGIVQGGAGRLFIPAGTYLIYAQATIPVGMEVEGASRASATIQANSATQNLFYVNSSSPCKIHGLTFGTAVTKTAGAAIVLDGGSTGSIIEDVAFINQFNQISIANAVAVSVHDTYAAGTVANGMIINNSGADSGDNTVYANVWDGSVATGSGLLWTSGGGLRFENNKILGFPYAFHADAGASVATSDFIISGNSMESGVTASGAIRIQATGGGGADITNVQICDNQIVYAGPCVQVVAPVQQVMIADNIMQTVGANLTCILLTSQLNQVSNNRVGGGSSGQVGIDVSGANISYVTDNVMLNAPTPYIGAATAIFHDTINGITFTQLPTTANGSVIYCSNGTIANPVTGAGSGCIAKRLAGVWVGN